MWRRSLERTSPNGPKNITVTSQRMMKMRRIVMRANLKMMRTKTKKKAKVKKMVRTRTKEGQKKVGKRSESN